MTIDSVIIRKQAEALQVARDIGYLKELISWQEQRRLRVREIENVIGAILVTFSVSWMGFFMMLGR